MELLSPRLNSKSKFLSLFLVITLLILSNALASVQVPQKPLPGKDIPKYVDPMPVFGPGGIPRVDGSIPVTVTMQEVLQQILPITDASGKPTGFGPTWVWAYKVGSSSAHYPGATIEAQQGTPTDVTYINDLPSDVVQKLLTVDQTIHWADPLMQMGSFSPYTGPVPAVAHLHGGENQSDFDGGPEQWFTPNGLFGPAYRSYDPNSSGLSRATPPAPGTAIYHYPNGQQATTLWFHDHALGATRLNVYGGLAAFYFIRDTLDTGLANNPIGLPGADKEIEIVIQDRQFDTNGQWYFPDGSGPGLNGTPPNPDIHPFWIPEFLGDVIVVNGKSWPYLEVEARRYRFRFLNGSNSRFFELSIPNGPAFWQIGTDGGFLDAPVKITHLLLGPAERADVIIDFSGFNGKTLTIKNSARTPFPKGPPPDPQTNGQVMQFRVVKPLVGTDTTCNPKIGNCTLRNQAIVSLATEIPDKKRQLTLNEQEGEGGPIMLMLNNTRWNGQQSGTGPAIVGGGDAKLLFGTGTHAAWATELPRVGSTEIWELINISADAHPIHIHLVQFQILSRQNFNVNQFLKTYIAAFPGGDFIPQYGPPLDYSTPNKDGALGGNPAISPFLQGPVMTPEPNEAGWKDTIIALPGQVTRLAIRWAPQAVPVRGATAGQNLYPFDPTLGPGYVWHCHILDHEDNEMMRPYAVQP